MSDVILEARSVSKSFGAHVVFRDLSLAVRRGETLTILGASGGGKSVLLKMLIGLVEPDRGAVVFDGHDVTTLDEQARLPLRRRISMLFQGGALFDSLSVADNIAYPLRLQRRPREEMAGRVAEALRMVDLSDAAGLMPAELSGGMKKRVALARAIAVEPDVVLYDEPTTGLDPITTRRIDDLMRSVQQRFNMTSVIVTHDLPSAFLVSDRIALLADGAIRIVDDVVSFRRSRDPAVRSFVDAMEIR